MSENERREMERKSQEAIKKMKEMNTRSSSYNGMPPGPSFLDMKGSVGSQTPPKPSPRENQGGSILGGILPGGKGVNLLKMLNLNNFKIDSDLTVIIALILLLSSEDSDELLLLALLYIML